MHNSGF